MCGNKGKFVNILQFRTKKNRTNERPPRGFIWTLPDTPTKPTKYPPRQKDLYITYINKSSLHNQYKGEII